MWRYNVVIMLREAAKVGEIKISNAALDAQYQKNWIVHFSKPTSNAWHTISYLGRYLNRPPYIAIQITALCRAKQCPSNF